MAVRGAAGRPTAGRMRTGPLLYSRSPRRPFPLEAGVGRDIDPGHGADRSPGESGPRPPSLLAVEPRCSSSCCSAGWSLRLTIAYVLFPSSGFETDIGLLRLVGPDAGEPRPRRLLRQRRLRSTTRRPTSTCCGPSACSRRLGGSDPTASPSTCSSSRPSCIDLAVGLRPLPPRPGLERGPAVAREALALARGRAVRLQPRDLLRLGPLGPERRGRSARRCCWASRRSSAATARARPRWPLAALVKPQFGVVLIPLVAVVLIKRHLIRPGSGPRRSPWGPRVAGRLARARAGSPAAADLRLVALVTFFVVALPFGMGPLEYLER